MADMEQKIKNHEEARRWLFNCVNDIHIKLGLSNFEVADILNERLSVEFSQVRSIMMDESAM